MYLSQSLRFRLLRTHSSAPLHTIVAKLSLFIMLLATSLPSMGQVENGFYITNRSGGVSTYRKDYIGGQPDFVTVAKLDSGAIVSNLTGQWQNQTIQNHPFSDYKNLAWNGNTGDKEVITIFNGTFFGKGGILGQITDATIGTWTPISFGLKTGSNITPGIDPRHSLVRLLCYDNSSVRAEDYSNSVFEQWPNVVGAFKSSVNYNDSGREKRNWFGLRDGDGNGTLDTIVFYFSTFSNKSEVMGVLRGFGCADDSMAFLDTGASSGYWLKGTGDVSTPAFYRWIPHAFAIYGRPPSNGSSFVADLTIPDGSNIAPGAPFTKTWRIRNSGNTVWGEGYRWMFDGGDQLGAPASIEAPPINQASSWDVSLSLVAPVTAGTYRGYWRMATPSGVKFGDRCWVDIRVSGTSEYIVDQSQLAPFNGAVGFWKWGTGSYWHYVTGLGISNDMLWTYNNDPAHGIDNMGDWRPSLPQTRNYEVYVFIPRNYATTTQARYEVNHAFGRTDVTVNQNVYYDQWVSLGNYSFNAGSGGFVRLADMTNETYTSKKIGFDAIKWLPR